MSNNNLNDLRAKLALLSTMDGKAELHYDGQMLTVTTHGPNRVVVAVHYRPDEAVHLAKVILSMVQDSPLETIPFIPAHKVAEHLADLDDLDKELA